MFAARVLNFTPYSNGPTEGFFDIEVGDKSEKGFIGVFTIRGCVLLRKNDGGFFYRMPQKKRMKKGEPVKDDKGYDVYDDIVGPVWTDKAPSKATLKMQDTILAQAVKCFEEQEASHEGRGSDKPARAAAGNKSGKGGKGGKPAKAKEESFDDNPDAVDGEDDDLPF